MSRINLKAKSLATKLIAATGGAIALVLLASNILLISQTQVRVGSLVLEQARNKAEAIGQQIAGDVSEVTSAARTMSGILGRSHAAKSMTREAVIDVLRTSVDQNTLAFGSWFLEAPRMFDGRKEELANDTARGANKEGTFAAYWSKSKNNEIRFSTFDADYAAEWYNLPAKMGNGAMTKPYIEQEAAEVPTAMTSVGFPVLSNGKLIGVSGIDVSLASLSTSLSKMAPFSSGRVYLLSQNGHWLVAPTSELLMKPYDETGNDLVARSLESGIATVVHNISYDAEHSFERVVYPFRLPGLEVTWVVLVDVPRSAIDTPVREQTYAMILIGLVVLASLLASLYAAVCRFVQRPLGSLVQSVDMLSRGELKKPIAGQQRSDEAGSVAKALEGFRHKLANTQLIEEKARSQRDLTEQERARTEAERAESSALQQQIVTRLGKALSHLASGDLAFRISDEFPSTYDQLKLDYNSAAESLEATIQAVGKSVGTLGIGVGDIGRANRDLSRRTEQQAANLEETAAALDELTSQVNASAETAEFAARSVESATFDAEQSGEVVRKVVSAMVAIENSSREVGRIISVIDTIAFQTNLLALNAGVEAARAGDSGKGFAVVAQEVRELAQRSANAAKEIESLVATSEQQVRDGVALVDSAGQALGKIAQQVVQINGLIRQISTSASEQAGGLKQINSAVNQMDQVTQQNAAMVEETTAASLALDEEADNLNRLVSRFSVAPMNPEPRSIVVQDQRASARASATRSAAPSFGSSDRQSGSRADRSGSRWG